jgi:hypothetical protein
MFKVSQKCHAQSQSRAPSQYQISERTPQSGLAPPTGTATFEVHPSRGGAGRSILMTLTNQLRIQSRRFLPLTSGHGRRHIIVTAPGDRHLLFCPIGGLGFRL